MNRIVLVGNGFDLACNLRTKYEHFLIDLIESSVIRGLDNQGTDQTKLLRTTNNYRGDFKELFKSFNTIEELKNSEYIIYNRRNRPLPIGKNSSNINVRIQLDFLNELMEFDNWSNIEGFYFEKLTKSYLNRENDTLNVEKVKKLNIEFDLIKQEFINYIKKVESLIQSDSISYNEHPNLIYDCLGTLEDREYERFFTKETEIPSEDKIPSDFVIEYTRNLETVYFVNFNYTSLLWKHLYMMPNEGIKYIPIHGQIHKSDSIIFGYGDDTHSDYAKIEQTGKNEFLKNMKSFYYARQKHYINLIDFLEDKEFDVFVVGHSLGLSDRVLLKTIFENENCKAIRLFHQGKEEDQFDKRLALSRHFDNKLKMRRKIMEWDLNHRIS